MVQHEQGNIDMRIDRSKKEIVFDHLVDVSRPLGNDDPISIPYTVDRFDEMIGICTRAQNASQKIRSALAAD